MLAYVDASAFVKLTLREPESPALTAALAKRDLVSSEILSTEVRRAIARWGHHPNALETAERYLEECMLLAVDTLVLGAAGSMTPVELGTLDAIHLATAVRVAPDLESFISYDKRLNDAAKAQGLTVLSPGA